MSPSTNPFLAVGSPVDELTASEVDAVRSELLVQRAEHSIRLRSADNQTTTLDEDGTVDVGLAFERFSIDRSRDAIIEIDAAIARLGDGSYGWCETCRHQIPFERLEAIPHARFCVTCADPAPRLPGRTGRS